MVCFDMDMAHFGITKDNFRDGQWTWHLLKLPPEIVHYVITKGYFRVPTLTSLGGLFG